MGSSQAAPDYYAILQVHPSADQEVIEAAYRQLMKKHHPDLAGDDPQRIREHLARAKSLNEAYSVLRNPEQRRRYDAHRQTFGWQQPPTGTPSSGTSRPSATHAPADARTAPGPAGRPPPAPPTPEPTAAVVVVPPTSASAWNLLALFGTAYYLLPGPYEWEKGSRKELLAVGLLPIVGVAAFVVATGRLSQWIGHSTNSTLLAWAVVALLCIPLVGSLPRVAMAGTPTLVVLSGAANPMLAQAHLPIWFAWGMASLLSIVLAARLFVFAVLPTVAACWLIAHIQ